MLDAHVLLPLCWMIVHCCRCSQAETLFGLGDLPFLLVPRSINYLLC